MLSRAWSIKLFLIVEVCMTMGHKTFVTVLCIHVGIFELVLLRLGKYVDICSIVWSYYILSYQQFYLALLSVDALEI